MKRYLSLGIFTVAVAAIAVASVHATPINSMGGANATVGTAPVSSSLLTPMAVVRKDTIGAISGTSGNYSLLQVDSFGSLRVVGSKLEDAAHGSGDAVYPAGVVAKTTRAGTSATDGDYVLPVVSTGGALYVTTASDSSTTTAYVASVTATGTTTKTTADKIYSLCATNGDGTNAHYLKIYDKATAATQADTPVLKIALKAVDTVCFTYADGFPVTAGISLRATTENADSGTTGADANDVSVTMVLQD